MDGNKNNSVLIIDDDPISLASVEAIVSSFGYSTVTFSNPIEARKYFFVQKEAIDIVICDIFMPDVNGITLASEMTKFDPNLTIAIMTSMDSKECIIDALNAGAFSFLKKPLTRESLKPVLDRAIERKKLKRNLLSYKINLEKKVKDKTSALNLALGRLEDAYLETMNVIIAILDKHEHATANHSFNVKELALILSNKYGITDEHTLRMIEYGALMHDIGKIGISDIIINKPAALDSKEREIMKTHSQIGYDIVRTIPILHDAAEIVYSHHERYDGKGYPRGLEKDEICIGARLFAVADAFDALRSDRPYRKFVSLTEAVLEINKNSGTQFDPDVVKKFNLCSFEMDKIYKKG